MTEKSGTLWNVGEKSWEYMVSKEGDAGMKKARNLGQ